MTQTRHNDGPSMSPPDPGHPNLCRHPELHVLRSGKSDSTADAVNTQRESYCVEPGIGLVQRLLIGGIHAYRAARVGRPSPCRFIPSCSAYGEEAIAVHGAAKGSVLTLKRITRCRPGGGFGVDLVPPRS